MEEYKVWCPSCGEMHPDCDAQQYTEREYYEE